MINVIIGDERNIITLPKKSRLPLDGLDFLNYFANKGYSPVNATTDS